MASLLGNILQYGGRGVSEAANRALDRKAQLDDAKRRKQERDEEYERELSKIREKRAADTDKLLLEGSIEAETPSVVTRQQQKTIGEAERRGAARASDQMVTQSAMNMEMSGQIAPSAPKAPEEIYANNPSKLRAFYEGQYRKGLPVPPKWRQRIENDDRAAAKRAEPAQPKAPKVDRISDKEAQEIWLRMSADNKLNYGGNFQSFYKEIKDNEKVIEAVNMSSIVPTGRGTGDLKVLDRDVNAATGKPMSKKEEQMPSRQPVDLKPVVNPMIEVATFEKAARETYGADYDDLTDEERAEMYDLWVKRGYRF